MTTETYNGKPCERGHTLRYRSNRKCVACSRREVRYFVVPYVGRVQVFAAREVAEQYATREYPAQLWRATRIDSS